MKMNNLVMIATAAIGTATLTVVTFWPRPISAGGDADAPPPKITSALLVAQGVEFAVAPAVGKSFGAGDQPDFELTALNRNHEPVSLLISATMTSSGPADMLSRAVRLPSVLWRQEQIVKLEADEKKVYALHANTNLPPRSVISVSLQEMSASTAKLPAQVVALTFPTTTPGKTAELASTR